MLDRVLTNRDVDGVLRKLLGLELVDALDHQILACRHKSRAQPHGIDAGTDELHSESTCMIKSTKHRWLMGLALDSCQHTAQTTMHSDPA